MANKRAYPMTDDVESGCKVGWRIYAKRSDARKCATAAQHNARIAASLGYDFGYCSPGSIDETEDGRFRVCIP
jgi:hypothetical protein